MSAKLPVELDFAAAELGVHCLAHLFGAGIAAMHNCSLGNPPLGPTGLGHTAGKVGGVLVHTEGWRKKDVADAHGFSLQLAQVMGTCGATMSFKIMETPRLQQPRSGTPSMWRARCLARRKLDYAAGRARATHRPLPER